MSTKTDERVRAIIIETLGVEPALVTPDVRLCPEAGALKRFYDGATNLGADSLDVVELVMTFEEEFGVEITDDEAEPLNNGTVQDACDLIASKVA